MLVFALLWPTSFAGAAPAHDPAEIDSPQAGEQVPLHESEITIKPRPYRGAKKFDCTVKQGTTIWRSGDQPYPICKLSIGGQAKFKPGPATAIVRVALAKTGWLPARTIEFEFTGVEDAAATPTSAPARSGKGAVYKLDIPVALALDADGWRVTNPALDVADQHVTFHHGSDPDATATLTTERLATDAAEDALKSAIDSNLNCSTTTGEVAFEPIGANRMRATCSFTQHYGAKTKRRTGSDVVTSMAGGIAQYDPATKVVATCGNRRTTAEHMKQVLKFCATMRVVAP